MSGRRRGRSERRVGGAEGVERLEGRRLLAVTPVGPWCPSCLEGREGETHQAESLAEPVRVEWIAVTDPEEVSLPEDVFDPSTDPIAEADPPETIDWLDLLGPLLELWWWEDLEPVEQPGDNLLPWDEADDDFDLDPLDLLFTPLPIPEVKLLIPLD